MNPATNNPQAATGTRPFHDVGAPRPVLSQQDELVLPKHRRMVVQYLRDEAGALALHLYHGDKEISFDEPDLFPFGETLAKQPRFIAGEAVAWGQGYDWSRIRDLLQHLIDEGVLVHATDFHAAADTASDAVQVSLLPPSTCPVARTWDECEAITREIAGRPVERGYLELIVPVFRVAHIAVDADQRQVGEANVFPQALRLDVPTEWRTCNLPGSRYQNELPMNVSAMRVMRAHWPQILTAVLRVREAYLRRFPDAASGWTVGHVQRLSVAVLALPTYQLMRQHGRVQNGTLHPALSSMFRVTDGVRMTMHQMLFFPANEPTRSPHQTVTVDEILDYAERYRGFHSDFGVCAGPRTMVRELLQVLLEGRGNADDTSVPLPPAVQAAFDDLDPAIDYAFHGLRAFATVFSLWPAMAKAYEQIIAAVNTLPAAATPLTVALRESMAAVSELLPNTYLGDETWRASRQYVYADMYQQCEKGLTGTDMSPKLDILVAPVWTDAHRKTEARLQKILRSRLEPVDETLEAFVQDLSACLMDFLLREQSILRAATSVQDQINQLLGREQPVRTFNAVDINVYNLMQDITLKPMPYLIDEMERLFDCQIDIDMNQVAITARDVVT